MTFSPIFSSSPPNDPENERAKESERMSGTNRKVSKEENKDEGQSGIIKDRWIGGPSDLSSYSQDVRVTVTNDKRVMTSPLGTKESVGRHLNQNREMPSRLVEESQLSKGAKEEGAPIATKWDIMEKLESGTKEGAEGHMFQNREVLVQLVEKGVKEEGVLILTKQDKKEMLKPGFAGEDTSKNAEDNARVEAGGRDHDGFHGGKGVDEGIETQIHTVCVSTPATNSKPKLKEGKADGCQTKKKHA